MWSVVVLSGRPKQGKTPLSVNLAFELNRQLEVQRAKILYVDLTPTLLGTFALSYYDPDDQRHMGNVLSGYYGHVTEIVRPSRQIGKDTRGQHGGKTLFRKEDLLVAPGSPLLYQVELDYFERGGYRTMHILRDALAAARYDWCILDPPVGLSVLTNVAIAAASGYLIVVDAKDPQWQEGLSSLSYAINLIATRYNPRLKGLGVVLTNYDKRIPIVRDRPDEISQYFADEHLPIFQSGLTSTYEAELDARKLIWESGNWPFAASSAPMMRLGEVVRELMERVDGLRIQEAVA